MSIHEHEGFLKAAGVKRLGRILSSAVKNETPELVDAAGRAAHKVTRRSTDKNRGLVTRTEHLTGRIPVFHGTDLPASGKIRSEGLVPPSVSGNISLSRTLHDAQGVSSHGSNDSRVFTGTNARATQMFGQAAAMKQIRPSDYAAIGRGEMSLPSGVTVKAHVKTWGQAGHKRRLSPYVSTNARELRSMLGKEDARATTKGNMFRESNSEIVFDRVHPRYIEGSPHFEPMTGREVVDHAKAHPERVRGGLRRATQKPSK